MSNKYIVFDIETLKGCFAIVAKDDEQFYEYCRTDYVSPRSVKGFLEMFSEYDYLVTYNGKKFDIRVLAWIASQKSQVSVSDIYEQAALLIEDLNSQQRGGKLNKTSKCWTVPYHVMERYRRNHFDVLANCTLKHSLKWWELARGWSVKESDVPWDKPWLTEEEVKGTMFYCRHDVSATEKLFLEKSCQDLILSRGWLIENADCKIDNDATAADISQKFTYGDIEIDEEGTCLDLVPWYDFDIPTAVIDGLMSIARGDADGFYWNPESNEVVYTGSEKFKLYTKGDKDFFKEYWITYGKGGAHYVKLGHNTNVRIFDVASLYPSTIQHHLPLKTKSAQKKYVNAKLRRIRIKRLKGTPEYKRGEDLGLKLVLNALTGTFRQRGSIAYAPEHGLAVCILGQLLITEATWSAIGKDPKNFKDSVIEINTDSFAVVGEENIARAREYCAPQYHNFEFEEEHFVDSFWKDVNHYVVYKEDGSIQETHGDLVLGSEPIIMESVYAQLADDNATEPVLLESDDFTKYLVKFTKSASMKSARIGDKPMDKKYYYFLWTTEECPNRVDIHTNADERDTKYGVWAFDPEDLKQYAQYIDRDQYMIDLRAMFDVWGRPELGLQKLRTSRPKKKAQIFFEEDCSLF